MKLKLNRLFLHKVKSIIFENENNSHDFFLKVVNNIDNNCVIVKWIYNKKDKTINLEVAYLGDVVSIFYKNDMIQLESNTTQAIIKVWETLHSMLPWYN